MNPFFVGLFGDHSVEARFVDGGWVMRIWDVTDGAEWGLKLTATEMAAVMAAMMYDAQPGTPAEVNDAIVVLHESLDHIQWGPENHPTEFRLIP